MGLYTYPKEEQPDPSKREVQVAVKEIKKSQVDETFFSQMEKEFEVIKRLKNKNIVEFIKLYRSKKSFYYVFELVRGADLAHKLKQVGRFEEFEC